MYVSKFPKPLKQENKHQMELTVKKYDYVKNINFPKISIITPSYNQGSFIEKTIQSVLSQDYPNIEYIIIDGGSTDNTIEIIRKYDKWITYWESEPDRGQSHALNKGFARATGDVFAWINSDDYYEHCSINKVMKLFVNSEIMIVNGNCMMHDTHSNKTFLDKAGEITTSRMLRYWTPFFCPPQPSIFFRKQVWQEVMPLNEKLNYTMDLDLWLKMSLKYKFTYYNALLSHYLIHQTSKSGSEDGFIKFIPEWRKAALKYVFKSSVKTQFLFWIDFLKKKKHQDQKFTKSLKKILTNFWIKFRMFVGLRTRFKKITALFSTT